MKSLWGVNAGNAKLRGKKHKLLHCGCCVAQDFRDKVTYKYAINQIKEYKNGSVPESGLLEQS